MLFDIFLFDSPFIYEVVIGSVIIIVAVVLFSLKDPKKPHKLHTELKDEILAPLS